MITVTVVGMNFRVFSQANPDIAIAINAEYGSNAAVNPPTGESPFPPINLNQTGNPWPTSRRMPANAILAGLSFETITASTAPLAKSKRNTSEPHRGPTVWKTFLAPTLPSPAFLTSMLLTALAIMYATGIEPRKYAITPISR